MIIPHENDRVLATTASSLNKHPVVTYLARISPGSQRTMLNALNTIARLVAPDSDVQTFPWGALRYTHTLAIRNLLMQKVETKDYAPSTVNLFLSALRGVLKECWRLELMDAEEFNRATDFKNMKFTPLPVGRVLEHSEISALWDVCLSDQSAFGARDLAMLVILRSGLRREEIVKLKLSDWNPTEQSLDVTGKGQKSRKAYIVPTAIVHLNSWLEIRGNSEGALLCPMAKNGKIIYRHLTSQAVWNRLEKRANQAGLKRFTPHDCRRGFATDLLELGVDLFLVQKLMGHSDPKTTGRYDLRGEVFKRDAIADLFVPGS